MSQNNKTGIKQQQFYYYPTTNSSRCFHPYQEIHLIIIVQVLLTGPFRVSALHICIQPLVIINNKVTYLIRPVMQGTACNKNLNNLQRISQLWHTAVRNLRFYSTFPYNIHVKKHSCIKNTAQMEERDMITLIAFARPALVAYNYFLQVEVPTHTDLTKQISEQVLHCFNLCSLPRIQPAQKPLHQQS